MAKGITQAQVDTAADALLHAGERPTVERVRALLGTGSPNTVTRMLEVWWQSLGARLMAQQIRMALPEAPAAVATLAGQLWEQALTAAHAQAQADLGATRTALDAERAELQNAQQATRDAKTAATASVEAAEQARALAEVRSVEAQRRSDQLQVQLADVIEQRAAMVTRAERMEQERTSLAEELRAERAAKTQEREAQAEHIRAVEDRAHGEVDRIRQEIQELRNQLRATANERGREQEVARKALQQTQSELARAQRDLASQTGRADALEHQLMATQAKRAPAAMGTKRRTAKPIVAGSGRAHRAAPKA